MDVIRALDINLSDRCNLACAFCYTGRAPGNGPDLARTIRQVEWALKQPGWTEQPQPRKLPVNIYGGEPLVEWETLRGFLDAAPDLGRKNQTEIVTQIVSNLTLLTQDKLDYLLARNVGIGCSIDGCPTAQDTFRKFADGAGSSARVIESAKLLLRLRPGYAVRMTVAPETLPYFAESVKFLSGLGFGNIKATLAGGVEWPETAFDTFRAEAAKITDWWIALARLGPWPRLSWLENISRCLQGRMPNRICSAGCSFVGIDTAGNVVPCHRWANSGTPAEWRYGNIESHSHEKILAAPARTALDAYRRAWRPGRFRECLRCEVRSWCNPGFGCSHQAMVEGRATLNGGQIEMAPHPFHCRAWGFYYTETLRALEALAANGNKRAADILDGKNPVPQQPCNCPNCRAKRAAANSKEGAR